MTSERKKTLRISKPPEIRKQEIIDTAMAVFMEKGYESATMRDIAKAMNVVPGLCYRYFESKQDLYNCAVSQYISEIASPMVRLIKEDFDSIDDFLDRFTDLFVKRDGREKYQSFFHKKENINLHKLLSISICEYMTPYVEDAIRRMNLKGLTDITDIKQSAEFMLFGEIPIIDDPELSSAEKAQAIKSLIKKILV